ncbi:MAG: LysR family transcriptional regulator [Thiolinea sp.]
MKFNLKQIEAFVWVADLGSFRKAAARLHTTQPNISGRIAALETVLDVRLMERDAGSVRLTSQGRKLLPYARKVLISTDEFMDAAGQNASLQGVLKLGVTEMVVNTWLRDFLKRLKEYYPEIIVELTVDVSVNIEKELLERSVDLALQNEPFTHQTSGNVDLGTYPIIWVASPELRLHGHKQVTLEEMIDYPILTHSRNTRLYEEVTRHFMSQPAIRLVPSSNLAACLHMAADAMGIASVPAAMVADELESGELVQINYPWTPESLHFLARYEAERSSGLVVKAAKVAGEVSAAFLCTEAT